MTGESAPAGADLEHRLTPLKLALRDGPVELPFERLGQRLLVIFIDALAVGGKDGIEKAQKQLRVGIVVGGNRALVAINLAEQKRLDETPGGDQRMPVAEMDAEGKRSQHIALDVDIAVQISFGNVTIIEAPDRHERPLNS